MPSQLLIGLDIGGTKTAVVASLDPPSVLERIEFPTRPARGPKPAIDLIKRGIRELLAEHLTAGADLAAIGVSCGSPLDPVRGVIQAPPNLATWIDVPITSILQQEFGVKCQLENDANAGAVAEHRFGAGQGCRHMIFITMGTGFGAGIISGGQLIRGANDLAGEIGHVRLTRTGPIGYHKPGSAEGWASGGGVAQVAERMVAAARRRGERTCLAARLGTARLTKGTGITARDVGRAAHSGDAVAIRIVRSTGRRLGEALAILVDLLNPERIVIGGMAMRLGDLLLDPAREVMRREALALSAATCQVIPAALDERIGDVAALSIAMGL
jgi:glucokinase